MDGRSLAHAAFAWRRSISAVVLAGVLLLGASRVIPMLASAAGAVGNRDLQGVLVGMSQNLDHPDRFREEEVAVGRFLALDQRVGHKESDLPGAWCSDLLARSSPWMTEADGFSVYVGQTRTVCRGSLGQLAAARAEAAAVARMDDRGAGRLTAPDGRPRFGMGGYLGALFGALDDDQPALAAALVADGDAYAVRAGYKGPPPFARILEHYRRAGCRSSKRAAFACAYRPASEAAGR